MTQLESARNEIKRTLDGVSGIGQTFDYFRHVTKESEIKDLFTKNGKLHFWCVCLAPATAWTTTRFPSSFSHASFSFDLHGWHVVIDKEATELSFALLAERVIRKFDANKKLRDVSGVDTVIESGPLQWIEGGGPESWRMMPAGEGGILCHYARLRLPVLVQTEP